MRSLSVFFLASLVCCILAQTPPPISPVVPITQDAYVGADCGGTVTKTEFTSACSKTTTGSLNYVPYPTRRVLDSCTYTTDNCAGEATCDSYNYGTCKNVNGNSVQLTWLINAQQLPTVSETLNITFSQYTSSSCSSQTSTLTFVANQCFQDGSASYAYNVVSSTEVSACGQGTCQTFYNKVCSGDAGPNGYVLSWDYNGASSTFLSLSVVAIFVVFGLLL